MSYDKIAAMILKLSEKTNEGKVKWESTATEGVYQAIFSGYAVRILRVSENTVLQIYNEEGELIEEVNDLEVGPISHYHAFAVMLNLYETARRFAMGTEQAIDSIMNALSGDDLPF